MEYPRVLLQIDEKLDFDSSQADFSTIATDTLATLLEQSRRSTSLIEDELRKRHAIPTSRVEQVFSKLQKDADSIITRGRIDEKSVDVATNLLSLMTGHHTDRTSPVCKLFLTDVLKNCSPECAFVSAISIGRSRIANLRDDERTSLLKLLKKEQPFLSVEPLSSLANSYGLVSLKDSLDSRKRTWDQANTEPLAPYLQKDQYICFEYMSRHKVELLPEIFSSGMKTSNRWVNEESTGGLAITNCLSVYLPRKSYEDAFFITQISYDWGFHIANMFGLGDLDNSGSVGHNKSTNI